MSLKLPLAPGGYDRGDQAQMRGAIERADQQNRKRQEDLVLGPDQRLVFYDGGGTRRLYTGAILAGLGTGTVTSVGLTMPGQFSVAGSPATAAGTLAVAWADQGANLVLAGPPSGGAAAPTFRKLVAADLPASGVAAGAYTNANVTVDAHGRVTGISSGAGSSGYWLPLVTGADPAVLVSDGAGHLVTVWYQP